MEIIRKTEDDKLIGSVKGMVDLFKDYEASEKEESN